MRKYICLILSLPMMWMSCTCEDVKPAAENEETVTVNFTAQLPQQKPLVRAAVNTTDLVDEVVMAVFNESGVEYPLLRDTIELDAAGSGTIMFPLQLIKGRTYNVAFWASKSNYYDLGDMRTITRKAVTGASESDYDAFTAHEAVTVGEETAVVTKTIVLKRPFAKVNVGVNSTDWNAVVNNFGLTPTKTMIVLADCYNEFDAMTGDVKGASSDRILTVPSGGDLVCSNGKTYKQLASALILVGGVNEKNLTDVTYSIYDENNVSIRSRSISNIPVQTNYNTNIVGDLMTGSIQYALQFEEAYHPEDKYVEVPDVTNP